jgi:glutamyl-tRNA synthetase
MAHSATVVTRIPPSPTGRLHIGTARTALFNYLFARHHGGKVMFRSEDTDRARSSRAYEEEIIDGLRWLDLTWDNDGETVYRQSEKGRLYREHLEKLIEEGSAYISEEESKAAPGTMVSIVRLRNPRKTITFTDLVRGDISFDTTELGDMVIARSLDDAIYHFAVVVDDHVFGVTHVLRGDDHISNTPRQILIQEAFGWERPVYAHLPLILAPDRSKLSKRHGATALSDYRRDGYLKEAIVNYLALLGWNPGTKQEIFSLAELVAAFDATKIHKGGAVFDIQKFRWFNRMHLRSLSDEAFVAYLADTEYQHSLLKVEHRHRLLKLAPLIRERTETRLDFEEALEAGEYDFFLAPPSYDSSLLAWKKGGSENSAASAVRAHIERLLEILGGADFSSPDLIRVAVWPYAEKVGRGEALWPLRVALSGREHSPDPFTIAHQLGREETLRRLKTARDKLG